MRTCFILCLFTAIMFIFTAEGTIRRVPQDYAKIQLAINAAVNGDTVLVAEGTYVENLRLTKKITLASAYLIDGDTAHISRTIIDGGTPSHTDTMSVITIDGQTDTTLVIMGFTLTKGQGNRRYLSLNNTYWRVGSAIDIAGGGARISNNILRSNNIPSTSLSVQGTISIWDPWDQNGVTLVIVENNAITDNNLTSTQVAEGAALAIGHNSRITGNRFLRNSAGGSGYGGAISIWHGNTLMDGNIISDNLSQVDAGGVYVYSATIGGIQAIPIVTMSNNIIVKNTATRRGGGIKQEGSLSQLYSINNTIADNVASSGGTGICLTTNAHFRALNTISWNPSGTELLILNNSGTLDAAYCCIRDGWSGAGNISADPKFVTNDPYYRLSSSSPALGAGKLSYLVGGTTLYTSGHDYLGMMRPMPAMSNPDLGAIEHPLGAPSTAAIIRVPQDYPKIQQAINAAAFGNIVLVSEGTYTENLKLTKKITLASLFITDGDTSHISRTIINGGSPTNADSASVINIDGNTDTTTVIMGFTIRGGKGTKTLDGAEIYIEGGGILVHQGGVRLSHNIIKENVISSNYWANGGGISLWPYTGPITNWIVENNQFLNNKVNTTSSSKKAYGGGASFENGVNGRFVNNIVINNGSLASTGISYAGAALFNAYSGDTCRYIISGNYMSGNTAKYGGALFFSGYQSVSAPLYADLTNNIITANTAYRGSDLQGALIHIVGGRLRLVNNTIADNYGLRTIEFDPNIASSFHKYAMINNIFWNPLQQEEFNSAHNYATGAFNIVRTGLTGIGNSTADPKLTYMNIGGKSVPVPQSTSPALGAGMMQYTVGGTPLTAPERDFLGNLRPQPQNSSPDLGAVEHLLPTPLPVELISFTAEAIGSSVELKWTTATEINNRCFEIERKNGDKFVLVGFVMGKGTTSESHNYYYTDKSVPAGNYIYRLKQIDFNGEYSYSNSIDLSVGGDEYALFENYPNPFNPSTTIKYSLPVQSNVELKVFDVLGSEIAVLVNGAQAPGYYEIRFPSVGDGQKLSGGVYLYRLSAMRSDGSGSITIVKKMILLK